ncbi:MAG: ABC transporter permease, partial [Staphylococcus lugdunensis]|nr:ABC transporter permease [Staphylococcus lugdunensis]
MTMTLLTTELKVLFRKKVYLIFSILLPLFFYLIFTSILDLPKAQQQVFNKEYMYSMVVFSLLNFCMMSFPLDMIEERANGWYKRLMVTPMSISRYYGVKVVRTMIQFLLSIVIIFVVAHFSKD